MTSRARELHDQELSTIYRRRHRVFACLFLAQWAAAIALAAIWSPYAWAGTTRAIHVHVYYAVILGGALVVPPILLMRARPDAAFTRHAITATQMLWSALIIHLTGGRIEAHFHVFGSLAFLAFYRDWTLLVTATGFVAGDHLVRGLLWSESVYGIPNPEWWRFIEHGLWVTFEDVVLVLGIREARRGMVAHAEREAQLESLNATVEETITTRTAELQASEGRFRTLAAGAPLGIIEVDQHGRIAYANPRFCAVVGRHRRELLGRLWHDLAYPDDRHLAVQCWADRSDEPSAELRVVSKDTSRWVALKTSALGDKRFVITFEDVTDRHAAEIKMAELNQKLVATARTAGMAEVAAGVLHNVGNVLNSVNASAEVATEKLRAARIANLQKAIAMLSEQRDDLAGFLTSAKGKALPDYLSRLGEHLAQSEREITAELDSLGRNIEHIKKIIHTQQSHARRATHTETFAPAEIIDDAFRIVRGTAEAHAIELVRDIPDGLPALDTDRHRVLQIVLNLIGNAIHAVRDSGGPGRVVARVRVDADVARIEVVDSGVGISPEASQRLFQHGFTTKRDGHGFGLHSAANAATELGGTLRGTSDGVGQGATFTLAIPRVMPRAHHTRSAA